MVSQVLVFSLEKSSRSFTLFLSASSLALFSLFHAIYSYGPKYLWWYLSITTLFSFSVVAVNIATGWPFGAIKFSSATGPKLFTVPLIIIIGWLMMSHPILVLARQISKNWIFLFGGAGLAAWALFLDPMMNKFGYFSWKPFKTSLPLVKEVPLSNSIGWLLSGMALMAILNSVLPKERRKQGIDFKLIVFVLTWVWLSRIISNIFVLDNPGVAILGGVGLGVLLIPLYYKSLLGDV